LTRQYLLAISLIVFGGFEVRAHDGASIPIETKKARALLSYLALQPGKMYSRDKLAALLWEESTPTQARHSLRQTLMVLRQSLLQIDTVFVRDGDNLAVASGTIEANPAKKPNIS